MRARTAAIGLFLFTLACGPSAGSDGAADEGTQNFCPSGQRTVLTGRVLAPNGIDPIPNALIHIPRQIAPFPSQVACEVCGDIASDSIVFTQSGVDGVFSLAPLPTERDQAPGTPVQVVVQIGRFRKLVTVNITNPCGENIAAADAFRLPQRNAGQDSVPKIAVVTGSFDTMECVLLDLGLAQDAFDLYTGNADPFGGPGTPGTVGTFDTLLADPARMKSYNIIFINCSANQFENMLTQPALRGNLENYVHSGGRLYVTDWSYDYIEQVEAFSPSIDFAPTPSGAEPEARNMAAIGDEGITTEAYVHDDDMAAWLNAVESVTGDHQIISDDRRVHIEHFLGDWVMQLAAPVASNVKVWLTGEVSGFGLEGDLPLTTSFDYQQCGRVLYSSYHTLGRGLSSPNAVFPSYCRSGGLSPQERVLMYLILHISDCLTIE